jgi:tetratricopeptide (TPR) repeat protein
MKCLLFIALLWLSAAPGLRAEEAVSAPPPTSPQAMFNYGTGRLTAGKLPEAEEWLQNAVASQDARWQPLALYNLGWVRVAQGAEILQRSQDAAGRANPAHVDDLTDQAGEAIRQIDEAITSANEQRMIAAYLHGGGVRREITAATKAVRKALESQRQTLAKWQRAAGDFRSAVELHSADTDARFNAAATEKAIAALIDKLNQLQPAAMRMNAAGQKLGDKMEKLKGMIPAPNMPPGAPGDEDNDDMRGLEPGQKEGAGKTGEEIKLSPEEAAQLLNGFKLGGERRLPLGEEGKSKPKNPIGRTW